MLALSVLVPVASLPVWATEPAAAVSPPNDPVAELVARLDLERYRATVKGLTRFGDRRQGTDRNRAAIDWIEAQLRSYGCTNTERGKYVYDLAPPPPQPAAAPSRGSAIDSGEVRRGVGGSRLRVATARRGRATNQRCVRQPRLQQARARRRENRAQREECKATTSSSKR